MNTELVIGIDVGSTSLSAVVLDASCALRSRFCTSHGGDIPSALRALDSRLDQDGTGRIRGCAITGHRSAGIRYDYYVDPRLACIRSVRERYPGARAILLVGGERFSLLRFDADGNYRGVRTNTSCAAGTGSFLDQQAVRLSMTDSAELSRTACSNTESVPLVATRCAVFAKTDLIHAQQEGYTVAAISEGLCCGLAHNLVDTLFKDADLEGPVVFTGGVSHNEAVVREIRKLIDLELVADDLGSVQGAYGAALSLLDHPERRRRTIFSTVELYHPDEPDRSEFYPPLQLELSAFPDFSAHRRYEWRCLSRSTRECASAIVVEVDIYREFSSSMDAYIGIDIGSTSTKAVVTGLAGEVYGGFYTRTAGRPLVAVQALFEAIDAALYEVRCTCAIHGSATTGSGRKFVGALINADDIIDEISAHARAACELDPRVDTIIEIGGQDSKFTTLRNGRVTFSVMNNVCAAGTGSFLEEQANRLGVPIHDFARLTEGVRAPLVSDRCTVFMDRDINYLLSTGHSVPEVLAAALHSVRENYLHKVAVEKQIGEVVFFQGATARNRSLVAAFEQRLGRPIIVSRLCHLTGALGAALSLADRGVMSDRFVGLDLYRETVPVRREVCTLCANHCKLTVADLDGRSVAFGFLCGRDYDTRSYVSRNASGFDLLGERRRAEQRLFGHPVSAAQQNTPEFSTMVGKEVLIGIPDALYMSEDRLYWEVFFRELSIPVRVSSGLADPVRRGKPLTGAEFCAPISALHGHAEALLEEVDYLFLPVYLERHSGENGERRKFCYYSQFVSAIISQSMDQQRVLSPMLAPRYTTFYQIGELHRVLSVLPDGGPGFLKIAAALDAADRFRRRRETAFRALYRDNRSEQGVVDVLLLGRPYTVLSASMNKGIPDLFASKGVRVFFQDMLEYHAGDLTAIADLLMEINWAYGATILEAAEVVAQTPGLYPVLLTSFKCGPDSFVIEYAKRIFEAHDKPYLILELDDHDSRVGYETRVEAALRSFNNHIRLEPHPSAEYENVNPRYLRRLVDGRVLVLPNWDNYSIPLIATVLNVQGYPSVVMDETETTIRRSLRWNNGQCIPMNALVEGFAETVRNRGMSPEKSVLWIPSGGYSCNIKLFPHHVQEILKNYEGMEKSSVYLGNMTFIDLSPIVTANAYLAFTFAGLMRRIACRIRPYELERGSTDRAVASALELLHGLFREPGKSHTPVVEQIIELFESVGCNPVVRYPKVSIFGDVYVRDNEVMNQDIVGYIEANGGEVVTMPFQEFTRMTANVHFRRWVREGKLGKLLALKPMLSAMSMLERWYHRRFEKLVGEPYSSYHDDPAAILGRFGVHLDNEGESQDNLLKAWYISRRYPDLSLFVQLSPMFCCAGLVTEAMSRRIEEVTGVPVLSITYDGTGGLKNDAILPYLAFNTGAGRKRQTSGDQEWPVA